MVPTPNAVRSFGLSATVTNVPNVPEDAGDIGTHTHMRIKSYMSDAIGSGTSDRTIAHELRRLAQVIHTKQHSGITRNNVYLTKWSKCVCNICMCGREREYRHKAYIPITCDNFVKS